MARDWHEKQSPSEQACGARQWRTSVRDVINIAGMHDRHLVYALYWALTKDKHKSRRDALREELDRRRDHWMRTDIINSLRTVPRPVMCAVIGELSTAVFEIEHGITLRE